jgi:TATA-box binding protein (TBP) (component of TFIID and TFIIIB)
VQGKISDVDIQRIAKELGENFTLQEIQEMVQEADHNGQPFSVSLLRTREENHLNLILLKNQAI